MDLKARRLEILQQVENGAISLEEASRWLAALDRLQEKQNSQSAVNPFSEYPHPDDDTRQREKISADLQISPPHMAENQPESQPAAETRWMSSERGALVPPAFWRGWWLVIFLPGLLLVAVAANWLVTAYQAAGLSWGFWLSFFPFSLGIVLMMLAWQVRGARWLHLSLSQNKGEHNRQFVWSAPLPVGWARWLWQRFGRFVKPSQAPMGESLMEVLDQDEHADGPLHFSFEGVGGSKVEIWIDGPR